MLHERFLSLDYFADPLSWAGRFVLPTYHPRRKCNDTFVYIRMYKRSLYSRPKWCSIKPFIRLGKKKCVRENSRSPRIPPLQYFAAAPLLVTPELKSR